LSKKANPGNIFLAWERIVFQMPRVDGKMTAAAEAEWEVLWRTHVEGENLQQTNVHDATLLCSLGWDLAMQHGDYGMALKRARRLFEHPNWQGEDEISRQHMMRSSALARWLLGERSAALEEYRELLDLQRRYNIHPVSVVRRDLQDICLREPESELASEDFARLSADVIRRFKGCVRVAAAIEPGRTTYEELANAFDATYR